MTSAPDNPTLTRANIPNNSCCYHAADPAQADPPVLSMNKVVFCDMDGVLVDLQATVREQFGKGLDDINFQLLNQEFWAGAKPYMYVEQFWHELKMMCASYGYHLKILTGLTGAPGCWEGKRQFVKRWLELDAEPEQLGGLVIGVTPKNKQFLAQPGRILIDDWEANIRRWKQANGLAVHVEDNPPVYENILSQVHAHMT